MIVHVFNPQYVKTSTLNYLCKIFKIKSVYNLIKDYYIDSYIANLSCEVLYNIRKSTKFDNKDAWKEGVDKFVETIYNDEKILFTDVNDIKKPKLHINIMVLDNNHEPDFCNDLRTLDMFDDFVECARNILSKRYRMGDSIGRFLIGHNINCFLDPIEGGSYICARVKYYDRVNYEWRIFLKKTKDGREFDPTLQHIVLSYRRDYLHNSKDPILKVRFLKDMLTEYGLNARKKFHENYEDWLAEEARRAEEEARLDAEDDWNDFDSIQNEFNSEMNDFEAWSNID